MYPPYGLLYIIWATLCKRKRRPRLGAVDKFPTTVDQNQLFERDPCGDLLDAWVIAIARQLRFGFLDLVLQLALREVAAGDVFQFDQITKLHLAVAGQEGLQVEVHKSAAHLSFRPGEEKVADVEIGEQKALDHLFRAQIIADRDLLLYPIGHIIKEGLSFATIGHVVGQMHEFVHIKAEDIDIAEAFAQIAVEQILDGAIGNP